MHRDKKVLSNPQNVYKQSMTDKYLWIGLTILSGVVSGLFAVWFLS